MRPALLDELPTDALRLWFTTGSLGRGKQYARQGRVVEIEVEEHADNFFRLGAVVEGSGYDYDTHVDVSRDPSRWQIISTCSCPVGHQCKHGAAVLFTARGNPSDVAPVSVVPTPPSWQGLLGEVLGGLERQPGHISPVGLQVELGLARSFGYVARYQRDLSVLVRPLRRGTRGTWVKGGAGWNDVAGWPRRPDLDRHQVSAMTELVDLRSHTHLYAPPSSGLDLAEFGAAVWPALQRARAAGVELVAGQGVAEVSLGRAARVAVDVVAVDDGFVVRAAVEVAGREAGWTGPEVRVLGERGHGVALTEGVLADGSARLLLAPLERPLDPAVRGLLESPTPVHVPADAADQLLGDYLPRLRRHLPVTSSDHSVVVPDDPPPRLRLTIGWHRPGRVSLRWQWTYPLGRHESLFPLTADVSSPSESLVGDAAGLRDAEQEQAVLDGLGARLGPVEPESRPQELTSDDVVTFVREILPWLREEKTVEVVDDGEPVDYRQSGGEPVISFDVAERVDPRGEGPGEEQGALAASTDWLDLRVTIIVDGELVPLTSLLAALTLGDDVVVLESGLMVPVDHPALVRLAEAVRAAGELVTADDADLEAGEGGRVQVGQSDLGLWAELSELGVIDAQASSWVSSARALVGFDGLPEAEPTGVVSDLRAYQLEGFRWLTFLRSCGLGGILADDMGLGKTLQALAAISHARAAGAGPVLVVAPTSVVGNWVLEAERHTPGLVVRTITSSGRRRGIRIPEAVEDVDVLVTSYTLLRLEIEEYAGIAWGGLVLDEAQQVKNHRGKTYQAVRCLDATFRLALTGTPFENRLGELWSLLSIVAPGLYPDVRRFTATVATPVEKGGDQQALARFRSRIRPFLLRRTKDLVAADLPPKQEQVLDVTLGTAHRKLYDARLQRERQSILGLLDDFDQNRVAIFAALTRLRQLSLDPGLVDPEHATVGSAKLDQLVEHLREIAAEGHRALVFSQFTRFLKLARQRLEAEGLGVVYLDGTTRDRPEVVRRFREGDDPVFLISLKAGGVGLTLTEADYVFVLDPWWNPAVEAQAVDRAHRIGQTRPVLVYRLVATDTIEEKVMELKARKAALFDSVLDGDAAMAQAMTVDDVRAMLGG